MTDHRTTWARHQTAVRTLREVLDALADAGIPAMPVKGILNAHLLYEDVAERPFSDIDIRAPRSHFRRLVTLAHERGWSPRVDSPRLWEAVLHSHDWTIDVECTFGPPGLCALTIEAAIRRGLPSVQPFGFQHLQPELHDHALLLVLNAFKDGLAVLPWALKDLLRITEQPGFDAAVLVARAREGRVASALWTVSTWLSDQHHSTGWSRVLKSLGPPPSRRVVAWFASVRGRGWSPKVGLLLTAASSDQPARASLGLALALAGVARGRLNRWR